MALSPVAGSTPFQSLEVQQRARIADANRRQEISQLGARWLELTNQESSDPTVLSEIVALELDLQTLAGSLSDGCKDSIDRTPMLRNAIKPQFLTLPFMPNHRFSHPSITLRSFGPEIPARRPNHDGLPSSNLSFEIHW